jgi:hypothetical protein
MIVLEALTVMTLAAACPAGLPDSEQWGFPAWKTFCGDSEYSECVNAIESKAIREAAGAVARKGDALTFRIGPDDEFVLRDEKVPDRWSSVSYRYWGQFGRYYLLRLQFYEGVWYGLLHKDTARLTKVIGGGVPLVSPDRKWIVSGAALYGMPHVTIRMWRVTADGIEVAHDAPFDGGEFGDSQLYWINDRRVDVCWRNEATRYLGSLRLVDGEWVRTTSKE